jgi:hypothetical protein
MLAPSMLSEHPLTSVIFLAKMDVFSGRAWRRSVRVGIMLHASMHRNPPAVVITRPEVEKVAKM